MPRATRRSGPSGDQAEAEAAAMASRAERHNKRRKTLESPQATSKKAKSAPTPEAVAVVLDDDPDYDNGSVSGNDKDKDKPKRKRRPNSLVQDMEFSPEFAAARTDQVPAEDLDPSSANSQQWFSMLEKLKAYKAANNHVNVPYKYSEDKQLGTWVRSQRSRYATRKMPEYRQKALEALGFEWRLKESNSVWTSRGIAPEDAAAVPVATAASAQKPPGSEQQGADVPATPSRKPKAKAPRSSLSKDAKWDANFEKLKAFHAEHGHWNVPMKYPEDQTFSNWVRTQRDNYNYTTRSDVPEHRVAKLNAIGFDWKTPQNRLPPKTWDDMFKDVVAYQERNGHLQPTTSGTVIGTWLKKQREKYHDATLEPERIAQLNSLGMDWTVAPKTPSRKQPKWDVQLAKLKDYKAVHGHVNILSSDEDKSLLGWVHYVRGAYYKEELSDEQIAQLEEIGLDWGPAPPKKRTWDEFYEALGRYVQANGDANVPYMYADDRGLGRWVAKQKDLYKNKSLEDARIQKLEALHFDWTVTSSRKSRTKPKRTWEEDFEALRVFYEANGHCNPTSMYTEQPDLYLWVVRQRDNFHKEKLSPEHVELLNTLGNFDWNGPRKYIYSKEEVWYAYFKQLEAFQREHGHCGTIDKFPEDSSLMDWMSRQHILYLKRRLTEDQVAQLESIGFAWRYDIEIDDDEDDDEDDRKMPSRSRRSSAGPRVTWNKQLQYLEDFKDAYNSFNVPKAYDPKLAEWVKNQRKAFHKGSGITEDKVEKLNAIGFTWEDEPPMDGSLVEPRPGLVAPAPIMNGGAAVATSPMAATALADGDPNTPLTPLANAAASRLPVATAARATNVHTSALATAAAAAAAIAGSPTPTATADAASLHAAAVSAAAASAKALDEAKNHRLRLQSELNQCRLSLHHLDKTNQQLKTRVEQSETARHEEALIMKNKLRGHEEELRAQQQTIQAQTQQLTQVFQQVQEMRQAQTLLLQQSHQPQDAHQQNQGYNFSYRL